jgi:hypothetical protein
VTREIRLQGSAEITGTVIGLEGEPVPGAKLDLLAVDAPGLPERPRWSQTTDKTGRFRFASKLPAGTYSLEPQVGDTSFKNVMIGARVTVGTAEKRSIELRPRGTHELEIVAQALVTAKRAFVLLFKETPEGEEDESCPRRYVELSKGRGVVRGLAPGRYRVRANFDKFGRGNAVALVGSEQRVQIVLPLTR